jgi:hypothetical protein
MIIVGLLLIVFAALLIAGVVLVPGSTSEIEFFGLILPNLSARALVIVGLLLGLTAACGLALVRGQITRRRRFRAANRARARLQATQTDDPFLLGP